LPNWRTAITRKKISKPARILRDLGLLKDKSILDYGCGKSMDYIFIPDVDRFDPHFYPEIKNKKYDVILCTYVLNVVTVIEQKLIINHIKDLLVPGGVAYFTVRRDIKEDIHYKDYSQRVVYLPFNTAIKHKDFEIYEYINL
jgi:2-polyprenyl-3-methyl-5-hydroxy-6-metoxy-1,4-benzoquinol methylase